MSQAAGIDIVGELLAAAAPVTAIVPVERMKMGDLPEGIELPAILLRTISTVDFQFLSAESKERLTERVSVMVRARTYRQQRELIRLVRRACKDRVGDFAGATSCAVLAAGTGPDMRGPSSSFDQTQDFRVSLQRDA